MRWFLIVCIFIFFQNAIGQNLIPNNDFELIYSYPQVTTRIDTLIQRWFTAYSSPDIFHVVPDTLPQPYQKRAIPTNQFGDQNAYSGDGYAGMFTHSVGFVINGNGRREWLGVKLSDTLCKNGIYCFKMNISLAEISDYANDKIGIYFSEDSIYNALNVPAPFPLDTEKLVYTNNQFYLNTVGWDTINLTYKAKGGEKYLYIGNFFPDSLVNWVHAGDGEQIGSAYYYIDDVSLIKCGTVGIEEKPIKPIKIYPNPAQDFVSIELPQNYNQAQVSIYNITGQLVSKKQLTQPNQQIPITELGNGMYIFVIQNEDKVIGRQRVVVAR